MSEAPPPMASPPPKKAPPSEADLLDNSTEKSPQTNSSKTDDQSPPPSSPSSSPPPSSPPPSPPTSPPPSSPPPSSPPLSPTPPAPDAPPPKPPASSPPPSSPPPSTSPPQPQTPPPPSSSPTPTNSPPLLPSPPPPLLSPPTIVSPPGTPAVFSPPPPLLPPPPKAASQTPVSVTPPPPPRTVQPPRSSNQGLSIGSGPSSSDSNIHGVIIAGITLGSVVIVALCIVIVCLICTKRKNKKPQYYMDPGGRPPKGAEQYYNNETPQWQNPRPNQNILLPPPPGYMGGWGAPPTPAPPGSGDYSGVYSSGVHPSPTPPSPPNMGGITHFSHEELASATSGFSQVNLLGQGGFGYVHKGVLGDKRVVAVKSLKSGSGQGEREFQAEVEIISRVHHRHLVSLVGYCIANQQRMLVYEFVPNSTLEFHLHGKGQPVVDWSTRIRIAVGSAKGLAYLHEDCMPRIIHRDIKAANILLDNNFEAMVADFGLAKLTSDNFTHVSTRVMGTFGYLAPEYASSGKLTEKSDVFSYGVMLLELITGRRPVDTTNRYMEDSLVDWARPLLTKALEDGNYQQLVDPRLEGNYTPHEMARMATCAAAAIRHSARRRPKMSQIVRALEGESSLEDLNEGVKPGQSSVYNPTGGAGAYDTRAYNADMLKFKQMVMSNTTDFNSSEYGATLSSSSSSSSSTATDHDQRHH